MATITFDQTGLSVGVTDEARSDGLANGSQVTITVSPSGGSIEFVSVPPGDTGYTGLTGGPASWVFNPTTSVYGTWLVQYTDPSNVVVRRAFSVRTPVHGLRIPAFNEKASQSATLANGATHIAESDDNEGGTYDGWFRTINELYQAVETGAPNSHAPSHQNGGTDEISVAGLSGLLADPQTPLSHAPSHKHGGADEVATATPAANAIPKALASGKLAMSWVSLAQASTSGPTSSPALNTLLFVDTTSNAVTVNLAAGHVAGDMMIIKMDGLATNSITIDPNGAEDIDGLSTLVLTVDNEWAVLVSNGSNWRQIG